MQKTVLFIETKDTVFGGQKALLTRCAEFERRGINYSIIHPFSRSEFLDQYNEAGLKGMVVKPRKNFLSRIHLLRVLFMAWQAMVVTHRKNIGVVHLDAFDSAYIIAVLRKLRLLGGAVAAFQISSERYLRFNKIDRILLRWLDTYATNSEFSKSLISRNGDIPANNISICYSPIAFDNLTEHGSRGTRGKPFTIGYVGSFDERKRLDRFVDYCIALKRSDTTSSYSFAVYGSSKTPEQNRFLAKVKKRISESGFEQAFRFGGYERIGTVADTIDLLFCPYENEPFGRVVPEFLFMNIPVIVTNDGGLPEAGCGQARILRGRNESELRSHFIRMVERLVGEVPKVRGSAKRRSQLVSAFGVENVVSRELIMYTSAIEGRGISTTS